MNTLFSKALNCLADSFYPRLCPHCGQASDRANCHLCWTCHALIKLHTHSLCECCGRLIEGQVQHKFLCTTCQAKHPAFDRARSAACYSGVLRKQIHDFKYNHALWLQEELSDLLKACLQVHFAWEAVDVIIPVPLHPVRQRERSYNQAELLAENLARHIDRRIEKYALHRMKYTTTQTRLDLTHRQTNIKDAFSVTRSAWIHQRCVLLIDDVMTTGATLNECARVLKKAGARTVWALTVARG